MTATQAWVDVFRVALKSMPKKDRDAILAGLVDDRSLRRDLMDMAVIAERRGEPTRPFRAYLAQRKR